MKQKEIMLGILSVGDEITSGDVINSNASHIASQLSLLGIHTKFQLAVQDDANAIFNALDFLFTSCDLVLTTGGLGPTPDDLTKESVCKYFNKPLEVHEESLKKLEAFFTKMNYQMKEGNKKQAYFPKDAVILKNPKGTAPGCILKNGEKTAILMPGPPREMKAMFEEEVLPYLQKLTNQFILSKTLRLYMIGEGEMAEQIKELIDPLGNPSLAPYFTGHDNTLKITARSQNKKEAQKMLSLMEEKVYQKLSPYIYAEGKTNLEEQIYKLLKEKNLTLSLAESCTAGLIASRLVNVSGISKYFHQSYITYSNQSKMEILGVKEETLSKYGAVSEQTVKEMALNVAKKSNSDLAIAVSGIAGPGGGSDEKPVGLVYTALYIKGELKVKKSNFGGDRNWNRQRAALNALAWLHQELS